MKDIDPYIEGTTPQQWRNPHENYRDKVLAKIMSYSLGTNIPTECMLDLADDIYDILSENERTIEEGLGWDKSEHREEN